MVPRAGRNRSRVAIRRDDSGRVASVRPTASNVVIRRVAVFLLLALAAAARERRCRAQGPGHPCGLGGAPGRGGDLGRAHDPGLPGPARLRALARRPEDPQRLERGDPHQLDRPLRPPQAPAHRHGPLRLAPRHRRGGVLRRHLQPRRQARLGLGRRAGRRPRLRRRPDADRDRPDPDAVLPRRPRLRQDAEGRPHLRRQQPRRRRRHHQPAGPHGHGDRPEDQPRRQDDRPRARAPALRRRLRAQRPQGLRDELDGPLGVGHRHAHGAGAGAGSCSRRRPTRSSPTTRTRSPPTRAATRSTRPTATPTRSR